MSAPHITLSLDGGQQQLHCLSHPKPLLLGEWPLFDPGEWNSEVAAAITKAVGDHRNAAHPDEPESGDA